MTFEISSVRTTTSSSPISIPTGSFGYRLRFICRPAFCVGAIHDVFLEGRTFLRRK